MKKFTIEDVRNYLKEKDTGNTCTLLSTEYKDAKTPLHFRCNKCKEEFTRSFTNVRRNNNFTCARCSQGRNLSIEEVQDFLNKNDIHQDCILLSTTYKNYYTPLLFKCNCCGQEFFRTMAQVKTMHFKCYDCLKKMQSGDNRLSLEDIKAFIADYDINNDCKLLSENYINQETPPSFQM